MSQKCAKAPGPFEAFKPHAVSQVGDQPLWHEVVPSGKGGGETNALGLGRLQLLREHYEDPPSSGFDAVDPPFGARLS